MPKICSQLLDSWDTQTGSHHSVLLTEAGTMSTSTAVMPQEISGVDPSAPYSFEVWRLYSRLDIVDIKEGKASSEST
jgi:hypothetical protein